MLKADLIAAIAEKINTFDFTKRKAEYFLKGFEEIVTEELVKGGKVRIVGFGTFEVASRAERTGRNPQTREEIKIPASKAPKFKAGKTLRDALNK